MFCMFSIATVRLSSAAVFLALLFLVLAPVIVFAQIPTIVPCTGATGATPCTFCHRTACTEYPERRHLPRSISFRDTLCIRGLAVHHCGGRVRQSERGEENLLECRRRTRTHSCGMAHRGYDNGNTYEQGSTLRSVAPDLLVAIASVKVARNVPRSAD